MAFDHLPPFHQMSTSEIARLYEQILSERDALRACLVTVVGLYTDADVTRREYLMSGWAELAQALLLLTEEFADEPR